MGTHSWERRMTYMDLISREAVANELEKNMYSEDFCSEHMIDYSINMGMAKITVASMPSAFEGMTVGEALKAVFPNAVIRTDDSRLIIEVLFSNEVWNAPYKEVSE